MDGMICLLITLITGGENPQLLRCALKADGMVLTGDVIQYYREPENDAVLTGLLPDHVKEGAEIIEVQEIFEVVIAE